MDFKNVFEGSKKTWIGDNFRGLLRDLNHGDIRRNQKNIKLGSLNRSSEVSQMTLYMDPWNKISKGTQITYNGKFRRP